MEFEIPWPETREGVIAIVTLGITVVLILVAILGYLVSPHGDSGAAVILSPAIQRQRRIAARAQKERAQIANDLAILGKMLNQRQAPNTVTAMLFAQQVYAHNVNGTAPTATARMATIDAAAAVAQAAAGAITKKEAVAAYQRARAQLKRLPAPKKRNAVLPGHHTAFLRIKGYLPAVMY